MVGSVHVMLLSYTLSFAIYNHIPICPTDSDVSILCPPVCCMMRIYKDLLFLSVGDRVGGTYDTHRPYLTLAGAGWTFHTGSRQH